MHIANFAFFCFATQLTRYVYSIVLQTISIALFSSLFHYFIFVALALISKIEMYAFKTVYDIIHRSFFLLLHSIRIAFFVLFFKLVFFFCFKLINKALKSCCRTSQSESSAPFLFIFAMYFNQISLFEN